MSQRAFGPCKINESFSRDGCAPSQMKSICLVMIVRNEAAIIRRCLDSVKGWITRWVICDTGSSDNTREIIREVLRGIPGELHDVPWVNFEHNRSAGMKLAKGKADYHLLIDADMTLNVASEFRHELTADAYLIRFTGSLDYAVARLVNDRHDWRYLGVTHEYVHSDTAASRAELPVVTMTDHADGSSRVIKYQRDIELLIKALETEPENARYWFYLAQSYRDIGFGKQAMDCYAKRASMGGWEEEVWYSLYQIARLTHASALPWPNALAAYLQAYQYRPTRLEPLLPVARFYREAGQFQLGFLFSRAVAETLYPSDLLFIEKPVYEGDLLAEFAQCCRALGLQPGQH